MKFKFKHLVAGTLACLTTLTPAIHQDSFGQQADQPTLESLLRRKSTATPLAPAAAPAIALPSDVRQVGYLSQDATTPGVPPLAPRPTAPTPLLPARTNTAAVPLPAPIVSSNSNAASAGPLVAPVDGGRPVPIVSASKATSNLPNVPIITAPLGSNITSSKLETAIGSGLKPTIDVPVPVLSTPALGSLPPTVATQNPAAVSTPATPKQERTNPIAAAAPVPSVPSKPIATSSGQPTATEANKTGANAIANTETKQPIKPTPPTIQPTTPAIAKADTPTTTSTQAKSDEIKVSEISGDELNQLMQAFGASPKVPAISTSASSKESIGAIGSGAILSPPTSNLGTIGSETIPMPTTSASAQTMVEPLYESYGLDLGYNRPNMPSRLPYDGYGTISGASSYLTTDLLYMARDGGNFTASYAPQQESYGFEPGVRMTLGRRFDSIEGREFGLTLMETMTSHTSVTSPTNTLFSWLQPGAGYNASNLTSLNNASFHHSFSKSHYYAGEYNRVNWNWDVMSTFIGLRYTGMDELYALHSVGTTGLGAYRLRARNHMVGPQVGGTLHYDIGRKLSFSLGAKIAVYANFYQTDTEFANETVRLMDVKDSRADLAWGTELGCFAHYSLTPRARIKGGYELWFYDRVATSEGQVTGFVSPFSGAVARNGDESLFYGFSLGLELFR